MKTTPSSHGNTAQHLLSVRKDFFDALQGAWSRPPSCVDAWLGLSNFFVPPDPLRPTLRSDLDGVLVQTFAAPSSWGESLEWAFSVLQAGDWLKIGVFLTGSPRLLSEFRSSQEHLMEIEKVWDRPADQSLRESGLGLEWRFDEPTFYDNPSVQDRFVILSRQLHFKIGRAIHACAQRS